MLGYIENRLKYKARKTRELVAATDGKNAKQPKNGATACDEVSTVNEDEMRDLINKMKCHTINTSDLSVMKADLRNSREYRLKLLLNERIALLEYFPYFFVNVDLVRI